VLGGGGCFSAFPTYFKDGPTMALDSQARQPDLEPNLLDTEPSSTSPATADPDRSPESPAAESTRAEPVSAGDRYFAVDVLRGFALLGILAMNIVGFGWPWPAYGNPFRGAGFTGLDRAVWYFNHMIFEEKMMTIFSMLFGAGLVLMDQRAEARGARIRGVYYRRILWLMMIGFVHSYLIWDGDILVLYAQTGLFLYFFRHLRPATLIVLGVSSMLVLVPLVLGFGAGIDYMKTASERVEAQKNAGEKPSSLDQQLHDVWVKNVRDEIMPDPKKKAEKWDKEMATYRGGYLGIVKYKAFDVLMGQIFGFLLGGGFFAASRMLVGMGLMKLGVFSAQRSRSFYLWMVALGYGLGFPLMIFDANMLIRHQFSSDYQMHGGVLYNVFGSLVVALGHVGFLMLIVQNGAIGWLTTRLAAAGRMALSNYLFDSIACTTLFYGYGFGLFGQINRTGLAAIVLTIWIIQLLLSPIWLKHFRYGPAEWVWRSLTYWTLQPMRQRLEQPAAIAG
jgi:uncharacterized protein